MSNYQPNKRHVNLGADTSNQTGAPWFVGDFAYLTVSVQSSTGSASRYTIIGSNDDGLRAALGTPLQTAPAGGWSILTTLLSQGQYTIDTGFRWVNAFRDTVSVSASSNATITFSGRV